jgi:hypothetical protein
MIALACCMSDREDTDRIGRFIDREIDDVDELAHPSVDCFRPAYGNSVSVSIDARMAARTFSAAAGLCWRM